MTEWLNGFKDWLASWLNGLLQTFLGWVTDAVYFVYDSLLTVFQTIITAIPVPASWAAADPWAGFPPQVYYILDAFNIGTCLAIIFAAWGIRFALNLIPAAFTRI